MTLVVTAEGLRTMLGDRNLLIVDTRSYSAYAESHIPGAVNIELMQFHWIDTSKRGVAQFNRQTRLLLSNLGVSPGKFIVFYDDASGPSAARGVWLLLYFSHEKVAMLDGGFDKWLALGYKTEVKANPFVHSNFRGILNPKILADYKRVKKAIQAKNTIIVDTRSKEEYEGVAVRAARAGHIPNAINIDWRENLEEGAFKSQGNLEQTYTRIPRDAEVITYCQGGYRAANSFVALKMLGYKNVRMYLGSWGEWGNKSDLAVSNKSSSS